MGKNNNKKQAEAAKRMELARKQPTFYAFDFLDVPMERYTGALSALFNHPDFIERMEKRNKLVKSADRMIKGTSEMTNLLNTVQKHDRFLADLMYASLVQANIHTEMGIERISFDTVLKYYVDYSKEGMAETVGNLIKNLDSMTFMADMIESKLIDIRQGMSDVFGGEVDFLQFDGVEQTLKQLRTYFSTITQKEHAETKEAQLYFEYADSISEYLEKRLKAYTKKFRLLHPIATGYTKNDMICALNQFFGEDGKFGQRHIHSTPSGGLYIDAAGVMFELTQEQSDKLNSIVGDNIPKDSSTDAMMRFSFAVTDAIMNQYKPSEDA